MTNGNLKGKAFERRIASELKALGVQCERGLVQTRSGSECADVEGTPFWIECKDKICPDPWDAFDQATRANDGRPVAVIAKALRRPVRVFLSPDLLIQASLRLGLPSEMPRVITSKAALFEALKSEPVGLGWIVLTKSEPQILAATSLEIFARLIFKVG